MATGTVKWFNATKGYGFIAPDNGEKDVFVHVSARTRSGIRGLSDPVDSGSVADALNASKNILLGQDLE